MKTNNGQMYEYRIIWHHADGREIPECGTWPTHEVAVDMADRSKRENIGPSSRYFVRKELVDEN